MPKKHLTKRLEGLWCDGVAVSSEGSGPAPLKAGPGDEAPGTILISHRRCEPLFWH